MPIDIESYIASLRVPSLDEILPAAFRERFKLGKPHQLGLSVPSVLEAAARLEKRGFAPFFIAEDDLDLWIERGGKRSYHGKMGVGFLGGYELELLEGGKGSNFYADAIRADGLTALHHVGYLDHDTEAREKELIAAGIKTGVRGRIKLGPMTVDFVYMDARDETGLYVEFIDYRMFGRPTKPAEGLIKAGARILKATGLREISMGTR